MCGVRVATSVRSFAVNFVTFVSLDVIVLLILVLSRFLAVCAAAHPRMYVFVHATG